MKNEAGRISFFTLPLAAASVPGLFSRQIIEGKGQNLLNDFKSKLISKVMMKGEVNKYILTPSLT